MATRAATLSAAATVFSALVIAAAAARRRRARAMRRLCYALPKAELHVHLHGCARPDTVLDLSRDCGGCSCDELQILKRGGRSLSECFVVFDVLHRAIRTRDAVARIAREALEDFHSDGVRYLEIRTTPRALHDADAEGYARTVIDVLASYALDHQRHSEDWPMVVRLLLSVDRTGGAASANRTVDLAVKLAAESEYVVGIDLSGNPTKGDVNVLLPALCRARIAGLRVAVHCGEVPNHAEVDAILGFKADRLGHALHLASFHLDALSLHRTPIEICPTSNRLTLGTGTLRHHPTLRTWLARGHPISINTDDPGVFATCASSELLAVGMAFGLSGKHIAALATAPLNHAFARDRSLMDSTCQRFHRASKRALDAYHEECGALGRAYDAILGAFGLYFS